MQDRDMTYPEIEAQKYKSRVTSKREVYKKLQIMLQSLGMHV
uniref:Uncharacterized protein n=1 Tax=Lepeophtheirus salmonis TaxID=72036 RepID=A0A0K2VLC1_LEPSM